MGKNHDTVLSNTRVPLDITHSFTGSTHVTCAAVIRYRALLSGRSLYICFDFFKFRISCSVSLEGTYRVVDVIRLMWRHQDSALYPLSGRTGTVPDCYQLSDIWGYDSSVAEGSGLRGCDAVSLGEWFPTFRNIVPFKTAWPFRLKAEGTAILRNVGSHWSNDVTFQKTWIVLKHFASCQGAEWRHLLCESNALRVKSSLTKWGRKVSRGQW
jgi:hypothetical protein